MARKCVFAHIGLYGDLDLTIFYLKFLEMTNTTQISLSGSLKFLAGIYDLGYGSKTAFLPMPGQMVTLNLDLWKAKTQ